MLKQVVNVKAVLPDGILTDATVAFENEKIVYIGKDRLSGAEISDGRGAYLLAGFVDIHCHGGAGYDFMDASAEEIEKIANFHLSHGSTTIVPTTMTDSWEHIYSALDKIAGYYKIARDTVLRGAHLEGPWLSPKQCGAQSPEKMDLPSVDKLRALLKRYPFISGISVASELENGMAVGRMADETDVVASRILLLSLLSRPKEFLVCFVFSRFVFFYNIPIRLRLKRTRRRERFFSTGFQILAIQAAISRLTAKLKQGVIFRGGSPDDIKIKHRI